MLEMKNVLNIPPGKVAFRARAVHRLARQKRWPAYMFAAVAQEVPHEIHIHDNHDNLAASVAVRAAHIGLTYLAFTLLD